jgi:hypothetical protein
MPLYFGAIMFVEEPICLLALASRFWAWLRVAAPVDLNRLDGRQPDWAELLAVDLSLAKEPGDVLLGIATLGCRLGDGDEVGLSWHRPQLAVDQRSIPTSLARRSGLSAYAFPRLGAARLARTAPAIRRRSPPPFTLSRYKIDNSAHK